jgi:uncharacterized protein
MHFAREDWSSDFMIRAYGNGQVTIGEQHYQRSLILTRDRVIPDWRPQHLDELNVQDLQIIESMQPEIVLLGTGQSLRFPAPRLTASLLEAGVGVEVMDTAAACRTYNILLSEERHVVAALLLR